MKKKIVVKVQMNCQECRAEALQTATQVDGVDAVAFVKGKEDEVMVTGDGVDAVKLVMRLRKKVGRTQLISVADDK